MRIVSEITDFEECRMLARCYGLELSEPLKGTWTFRSVESGRVMLDYWPASGLWLSGITHRTGNAEHWSDAVKVGREMLALDEQRRIEEEAASNELTPPWNPWENGEL